MPNPNATALSVEQFLQQVQSMKTAGTYDPGDKGGGTSHPSKKVDSNTHEKVEGERSVENDEDVKENIGDDLAIVGDGPAPKKAGESIPSPGLREGATGEDPQNETQRTKRTKDDGGKRLGHTTHAARADNPGLDSIKYAELSLEEHAKLASDLGNQLLASLSTRLDGSWQKEASESDADDVDAAAQVGWELAGLADERFDKQALDQQAAAVVEDIIKTASDDADLVLEYLASFSQERQDQIKQAQAQKRNAVSASLKKMANMGGMPPEAAAAAGGGAMPPEAAGGMPPEAAAAAGAPGEGGDAETEQLIAMLEQMAAEQGVSVEELIQELLGSGGSDDAAEPPESDTGGMEIAAADKSKKPTEKTAAPKKASSARNSAQVNQIIQELMARSRR